MKIFDTAVKQVTATASGATVGLKSGTLGVPNPLTTDLTTSGGHVVVTDEGNNLYLIEPARTLITLSGVVATDVVIVNGVSFTCVAAGATGEQFNVGITDTLTAVQLAAAINGYFDGPLTGKWFRCPGASSVSVAGSTTAGAGTAVVKIEVSNDGVNPVGTPLGTISLILATAVAADGFTFASEWAYIRAVLETLTGTGAAVAVSIN